MVIALTALVLALVSGVVNYRQNNLSSLESGLRDTKDQLQLAKNDIDDIKLKTIQQRVDAELAIKGQDKLKQENRRLQEALSDANARVMQLEARIRKLDNRLTGKTSPRQRKTYVAEPKRVMVAAQPKAKSPLQTVRKPSPATADLDLYTSNIAPSLLTAMTEKLSEHRFHAKFPAPSAKMSMATTTTVFYYDRSYKRVANDLLSVLSDVSKKRVILRRGSSPFAKNKIVVHLVGR